jgi:hypothetical protein
MLDGFSYAVLSVRAAARLFCTIAAPIRQP